MTVVVIGDELNVEATGAKTLTVANVDSTATAASISVKKGSASVNCDSIVKDGDKWVITTSAKMNAGTYTVTAGDKSAAVEVEDERVVSIAIDNADGFVGVDDASSPSAVYVHYTVTNQYGEDITSEISPSWTSSSCTGSFSATDPRKGLLVVRLSNGGNWNYGTSIFLSGVYTKGTNVVTTQATVKVGLERVIANAEVLGVVATVDNTVRENTIPAGFDNGKYVLAMQTYDQYGYPSDDLLAKPAMNGDLTKAFSFVSENPVFIKSSFTKGNDVTIKGEIYPTVKLVPGDYANKGGSANIQIISQKAGTVTKYEISTKDDQILTSFKIGNFNETFADGETHEIPFTALDQNGEEITSFAVLNKQITLNSSTSLGSSNDLYLEEQNDGTAKLKLYDSTGASYSYTSNNARDNVDRYVMLTSIITSNGNYSDSTLYIKDKAYPATITGVNPKVKSTIIEGGSTTVYLSGYDSYKATGSYDNTFLYLDQYGREIVDVSWSQPVYGWFHSGLAPMMQTVYTGTEFDLVAAAGSTRTTLAGASNTYNFNANADKAGIVLSATGSTNTTADATITFSLYAPKSVSDPGYEVKGISTKRLSFTLADIKQATNFAVETGTMFVDTSLTHGSPAGTTGAAIDSVKHEKKVVVTAKVNGADVIVPSLPATGSAVNASGNSINTGYYMVETLTSSNAAGSGIEVATKAAADSGTVDVYLRAATSGGVGAGVRPYDTSNFFDTSVYPGTNLKSINNVVKVTIMSTIDGVNPKAVVYSNLETKTNPVYDATLKSKGDSQALKATDGVISTSKLFELVEDTIYDQYGVKTRPATECSITVSNVIENQSGLYSDDNIADTGKGSITVSSNGLPTATISNAERGDTFTVTFTYGSSIRVSVNVTVGADNNAKTYSTTTSIWQ